MIRDDEPDLRDVPSMLDGAAETLSPAPWERIPGEPAEEWALFSRFCTSQARTIKAFAVEVGWPESAIAAMSARWRWRARRAALEEHLAATRFEGAQDQAREQGAAHARVTTAALEWAAESIHARRARGEVLDARTALAMTRTMIELQRVALGQATARTALDLSSATDDALERLRDALEQAKGSAGG